jgi:MFS family permease
METVTPIPVNKSAVSALVLGETISVLGTRMTYLALPWFVLVTTGSPGKMSLVLAAQMLPMAILGIPSGTAVQRLGSRTTMLIADFARHRSSPRFHSCTRPEC